MIISYSILEEFLSEKFQSLSNLRVDDYYFFDECEYDSSIIHIVFSLGFKGVDGLDYSDSFGEDILLSEFMEWLVNRRGSRLDELGI